MSEILNKQLLQVVTTMIGFLFMVSLFVSCGEEEEKENEEGFFAERIVYQVTLDEQNNQIYMMAPDGSNQIELTHTGANYNPSLSPNGKMIAFANDNGIYVMNTDGTAWRWLCHPDIILGRPSWAADSEKLLFCAGFLASDIYTIDISGNNLQKLIFPKKEPVIISVAWSPNGKKIVFAMGPLLAYEIYTMNSDGSNIKQSTHFTPDGLCIEPSWSPDGKQILFVLRDYASRIPYVMIMNDDGSNIRRLVRGDKPTWSPDGTRIAYAAEDEQGDTEIYTIGIDGRGRKQLTFNSVNDSEPFWGIVQMP